MKFIIIVIVSGIIGFIVSIMIITYPGPRSPFSELVIKDKKEKVDALLSNRIITLNQKKYDLHDTIQKTSDQIMNLERDSSSLTDKRTRRKEELKAFETSLKAISDTLNKSIKERNELKYSNSDTLENYYKPYFTVDRNTFYDALNRENFKTDTISIKKYIKFNVVDPVLLASDSTYTGAIKDAAFLTIEPSKNKVAFLNKYPAFGLWLVVTITQVCIWFMIAALIISMTYDIFQKLK